MAAINVGGTLALEMNGNGTLGPGLDQLDWQWLPTIRRGANAWPALTTNVSAWLRIVKRNLNGLENYIAYSSADDVNWTQSGTWVHTLGSGAKVCLFAGNLAGYTATFDYVHVSTLQ